jgi:hypothetical protein
MTYVTVATGFSVDVIVVITVIENVSDCVTVVVCGNPGPMVGQHQCRFTYDRLKPTEASSAGRRDEALVHRMQASS